MRRTKIVCTIGPASEGVEMLCKLIEAGMNVARLNFSHGNHEEHGARIENIRKASEITKTPVAIMLDTKGPEIRTGLLKGGKATLVAGEDVIVTTEIIEGDKTRFSVNYPQLIDDISVGDEMLLDDGLIGLGVVAITGQDIHCTILNSGELSNQKGVNVPGVAVSLPAITKKDYADICFGIEQGVDFIAASFIRSAADVLDIRKILEEHGAKTHIIAKIENEQGVSNLDEILEISDGLMVARGDLGVEIPAEQVPLVQKKMIAKCNKVGKPVITATQMLDSMSRNPRPTRAEASDVANAIFDGTDGIMLSGETAAGKYPVEAVQTMDNIARMTETALRYDLMLEERGRAKEQTTTEAISYATCTIARSLGASAIITATESGSTARMVSKYRPESRIIAVTNDEHTLRKLLLVWGVTPIIGHRVGGTDEMIQESIQASLDTNLIEEGDLVVLTAGVPVGTPGTTNLLKVEVVGKILAKGTGMGQGSVVGFIKKVSNEEEAMEKITPGDILLANSTDASMVAAMSLADAVITEEAGLTSHGAIVCLSLGKPVIVGASGLWDKVNDGDVVTIDLSRGIIYSGHTKVK